MNKNLSKIFGSVVALVIAVIAAAVVNGVADKVMVKWDKKITGEIVRSCSAVGKIAYQTDDGANVEKPEDLSYERCLEDNKLR